MSEPRFLSELFDIQPPHWGLRGDPLFWQELRQRFAGTPFPYSSSALVADIRRFFKEKTGTELTAEACPYVAEYARGGMSSGQLSGRWWLGTALPILISLRDIAEADMQEFDAILKDGSARFAFRSPPCTPA